MSSVEAIVASGETLDEQCGARARGRRKLQGADETVAGAVERANQRLRPAVVTEGHARRLDPAVECRVRDDAAIPEFSIQLFPRYDAVSVLDQI